MGRIWIPIVVLATALTLAGCSGEGAKVSGGGQTGHAFAGNYRGSYAGSNGERGTIAFDVSQTGTVSGTTENSMTHQIGTISGTMSTSGIADFSIGVVGSANVRAKGALTSNGFSYSGTLNQTIGGNPNGTLALTLNKLVAN